MKNVVRAFALSLVVTGAFASAHLSLNEKTIVAPPRIGAAPPPWCGYDDPNACGMGGPVGN